MCSRLEEDEAEELMPTKEKLKLVGASCRKCGVVKASVVLQSKFPYCVDCFIAYVSHKYRSTLGKSKIMKHGDVVLVGFTGAAPSVCLVDLIRAGLEDTRKKKIRNEFRLVFIDEFLDSSEHRSEALKSIDSLASEFNFAAYYTHLNTFFEPQITLTDLKDAPTEVSSDRISKLLNKTRTLTSKNDVLVKLRQRILYEAAKLLGCNKVFTAETSDRLAVNILSNVSLGRGSQLATDVGFCDERFGDVVFVRPLIECSRKEVNYYNVFRGLKPHTAPNLNTKCDKYSSIQKLTEAFVSELSCSFPSTVSTVVSTANKLSNSPSPNCIICRGHISPKSTELCAYSATQLSSQVSLLGSRRFDTSFGNVENDSSEESLCYACEILVKDSGGLMNWPQHKSTVEDQRLAEMRHEIQDCLLPSDS